jgi:hypothetical protein
MYSGRASKSRRPGCISKLSAEAHTRFDRLGAVHHDTTMESYLLRAFLHKTKTLERARAPVGSTMPCTLLWEGRGGCVVCGVRCLSLEPMSGPRQARSDGLVRAQKAGKSAAALVLSKARKRRAQAPERDKFCCPCTEYTHSCGPATLAQGGSIGKLRGHVVRTNSTGVPLSRGRATARPRYTCGYGSYTYACGTDDLTTLAVLPWSLSPLSPPPPNSFLRLESRNSLSAGAAKLPTLASTICSSPMINGHVDRDNSVGGLSRRDVQSLACPRVN